MKIRFLFPIFLILYFSFFGFVLADELNQNTSFYVEDNYDYSNRSQVSATLRKVSSHAYWYIEDEYWFQTSQFEKSLFSQELDKLAEEFDSKIYPQEISFWGSEPNPGIDNDSRITILVTRLISQAGGYYDTSNQYLRSRVSESNEREIIFINSTSILNGRAKTYLAHEFQHLIDFHQKEKLRNIVDDVWLNELRSEYSVKLLGYDDNFNNSNLERRLSAFLQSPSEPLAEWKNLGPDYGAITLFSYYLTDHYGDRILVDSLLNFKIGIESLDQALLLTGFKETFSDIFSNWTIVSILNDQSVDQKYAYKSPHLVNFRISPTQAYSISGSNTSLIISNSVKDWQPVWYEFSTPVNSGSGLNLRIDFSADPGTKFKIPYVGFKINGQKEVGYLPVNGNSGTFFLKDFGSDFYRLILIPANHSKTSGFGENDPTSFFNLKVQLTAEFEEIKAPAPSQQMSAESLVQDLILQIAALQAQINQLTNQNQIIPISPSAPLNRNLSVGSQGEDVRWLQDFLVKNGVYPEAKITGYFGTLTQNAVIRFQQKYGIFPQIGYVGIKTRMKIQELTK